MQKCPDDVEICDLPAATDGTLPIVCSVSVNWINKIIYCISDTQRHADGWMKHLAANSERPRARARSYHLACFLPFSSYSDCLQHAFGGHCITRSLTACPFLSSTPSPLFYLNLCHPLSLCHPVYLSVTAGQFNVSVLVVVLVGLVGRVGPV